MSNAAQICVRQLPEEPSVALYTHCGADNVVHNLQSALARRVRWDNAPYLARIILDHLKGYDFGELGFGIGAGLRVFGGTVVDITVTCGLKNLEILWNEEARIERFSFEEFLNLTLPEGCFCPKHRSSGKAQGHDTPIPVKTGLERIWAPEKRKTAKNARSGFP